MPHQQTQSKSAAAVVTIEHPPEQAAQSLLDRLLGSNEVGTSERKTGFNPLHSFLTETSPGVRLKQWLGQLPKSAEQFEAARLTLARDIARIDSLLCDQVNAILHAPEFQRLEATWRGLHYLWETRERLLNERGFDDKPVQMQIRMLDVSKKELQRDFERAADFDQNALFMKVYEGEFGIAGGTPYGMLIADYEFTNHPDDIDLLSQMSGVAACAFAPIITSAAPNLVGLDDFSDLDKPVDLENIFQQARHRKWRSLRERPDTQFLGLTLPRVLMREPWLNDGRHDYGFRFEEDVQGADRSKFLWGNSAWAMGAVILRAFDTCGWFADIRGVERGAEAGGLVNNLPTHDFHTDAFGVAMRSNVEVAISDTQESELSKLGFIPLSHCKDTPYSVFYSNQSVHRPEVYDDPVATANAGISAMLQYVLCCSRIAHYLKVKARDKLGSHLSPIQIQNELQAWVINYVTADEKADPSMKALYPLREAQVEVTDIPGQPGKYMLTMRLLPHYQLDQLSSTMTLVARRVDLKD
ncbi:MAG: type VI secretion system contractile sheath large subunit [Planctomycetaceae bacterium]